MSDEPLLVRIEAGPKPYDVKITTEDGQPIGEAVGIKWECSAGDPVPRATLELDMVGAALEVRPSVTLVSLDNLRFPLPSGLSLSQVRELQERVGALAAEAYHLYRQRARLIRELHRAGVKDTGPMMEDPEADVANVAPSPQALTDDPFERTR